MRWTNSGTRFGLLPKLLHWSIAVLIVGLIALGWWMVDLTYYDPWYNTSLSSHRALGLLALLLGALKIVWVLLNPSPALAGDPSPFERFGARAAHLVFYVLMLLIPVSGYLISTSAGKAIDVFGWFEVPALVEVDDTLREQAIAVHYYAAYGSLALLAVHAGAALKHQFIDGDGTLARMLWR